MIRNDHLRDPHGGDGRLQTVIVHPKDEREPGVISVTCVPSR